MRKLLLALGILALLCQPVLAGPNSNGAIIVHTNDAYNYSAGTACTTTLGHAGELRRCAHAEQQELRHRRPEVDRLVPRGIPADGEPAGRIGLLRNRCR